MAVSNTTFRGRVSTSEEGDPYNKVYTGTTTPGSSLTTIDETVSSGKEVHILQIYVICRQEGKIDILIDGTNIGSGRTGAAAPNFNFSFLPYEKVSALSNIKVNFLGQTGKPDVDIEAYLQAREITL